MRPNQTHQDMADGVHCPSLRTRLLDVVWRGISWRLAFRLLLVAVSQGTLQASRGYSSVSQPQPTTSTSTWASPMLTQRLTTALHVQTLHLLQGTQFARRVGARRPFPLPQEFGHGLRALSQEEAQLVEKKIPGGRPKYWFLLTSVSIYETNRPYGVATGAARPTTSCRWA